jgi:hypothetical protein
MSVYVDNYNAPFGRMIMCHMMADTREELLSMCTKIGVQHKWIQHKDTWCEHFDICLSKKAKAIQFGAIELTARDMVSKFSPYLNKKATEASANLTVHPYPPVQES